MQPYFLPYLGYFQLMAAVDKYVIYDDVQYIVRGWVNRNRIAAQNKEWGYLNVQLQGVSQKKAILEIGVDDNPKWRRKALGTVRSVYGKSPHFKEVYPVAEKIINFPSINLADFLTHSLRVLIEVLNLDVELIESSRKYNNADLERAKRLQDICQQEGSTTYINAIGGRELYTKEDFANAGVDLYFLSPDLTWPDSLEPPEGGSAEDLDLSILHLLFTYGSDACKVLVKRGNLI